MTWSRLCARDFFVDDASVELIKMHKCFQNYFFDFRCFFFIKYYYGFSQILFQKNELQLEKTSSTHETFGNFSWANEMLWYQIINGIIVLKVLLHFHSAPYLILSFAYNSSPTVYHRTCAYIQIFSWVATSQSWLHVIGLVSAM